MTEALGFITDLQNRLADLLGLTFQKDGIDYTRKNFRPADIGWEEMKTTLEERQQTLIPGQGLLKFIAPVLSKLLELESKRLERSGHGEAMVADIKRQVAPMLARAPELLKQAGIHDPDKSDDVIITQRNLAAFAVLDETLAEGVRSVAIFYGAGHLPDMHRRLLERGFRLQAHYWLDAWSIPR